jgi:serine-type D-Ala-D-Ala carboxypeptidase/endopeptidase (penicillin-binding protein 4)
VHVNNRTVTVQAGSGARLELERDPAGPGITLSGLVPTDTPAIILTAAVRGPADYFLAVLRETLREAGVVVEGQALTTQEWPEARRPSAERPLFAYASPPLREILPGMLKPSQNWIAETLLRTLGRERRGEGSASAGVAVVDSTLRAWRLPLDGFRMVDGSGLSRYDLVTPELFAGVLSRMRSDPAWPLWYTALPAAGQSGTLENRMQAAPLRGNVHAKTGTLSGVRSLAGYLETERGETLVFTILINNHLRSAAAADRVAEAALQRLYYGTNAR